MFCSSHAVSPPSNLLRAVLSIPYIVHKILPMMKELGKLIKTEQKTPINLTFINELTRALHAWHGGKTVDFEICFSTYLSLTFLLIFSTSTSAVVSKERMPTMIKIQPLASFMSLSKRLFVKYNCNNTKF